MCCVCSTVFEFTAGQQRFFNGKGFATPKRCKDRKTNFKTKVRDLDQDPSYTIDCVGCEEEFDFTPRQQRFYRGKGFKDPVHCSACQKAKRELKKQWQSPRNGGMTLDDYYRKMERFYAYDTSTPCSFCDARGHDEDTCYKKKAATCQKCGKVGYAVGEGIGGAKGRKSSIVYACSC